MSAGNSFPRKLIQGAREPLGHLAAVYKKNGRVARPNNLKQARMNCVPNRNSLRRLRGRTAGQFLLLAYVRHVFNRDLDAQLQLLGRTGVDDGHRTIAQRRRIQRIG